MQLHFSYTSQDEQGISEPSGIHDVTNTTLSIARRSTSKKTSLVPKEGVDVNSDPATTSKRTTRRAVTRGGVSAVQGGGDSSGKKSGSEDVPPATTASKCRTRARTTRKVKQRRATEGECQENADCGSGEDGSTLPKVGTLSFSTHLHVLYTLTFSQWIIFHVFHELVCIRENKKHEILSVTSLRMRHATYSRKFRGASFFTKEKSLRKFHCIQ